MKVITRRVVALKMALFLLVSGGDYDPRTSLHV